MNRQSKVIIGKVHAVMIGAILLSTNLLAQDSQQRSKFSKGKNLKVMYEVLADNEDIRHGKYSERYNDKLITLGNTIMVKELDCGSFKTLKAIINLGENI